MEHFYAAFTRERQFIHNVSENTLDSYRWACEAFENALTGKTAVSKAEVVEHIGVLRSKGSSPVTINTYLRSLNAFLRWLHEEGYADTLVRIPKLKEQQKVIQTFSEQQVRSLIGLKGKTRFERQIQTISCLILDTGLRIDEALSLDRETDIDLENLLLTVRDGKGGKGRVVPFSPQMRKRLYRHLKAEKPAYGSLLFFAGGGRRSNNGTLYVSSSVSARGLPSREYERPSTPCGIRSRRFTCETAAPPVRVNDFETPSREV